MDEQEFVTKFIHSKQIEQDRYSCLRMVLDDVRKLTGRNVDSGAFGLNIYSSDDDNTFINPRSFLGVIGYLLVLDMIGVIFEKKTTKNGNKDNNIIRCLSEFGTLKDTKQIAAIKALRNSLVHNYSLVNIPDKKKKDNEDLHKFILDHTESLILMKLPDTKWKRDDYQDKSDITSTIIYSRNLCDEVESVYSTLKSEWQNNNVTLRIEIAELIARFTTRI